MRRGILATRQELKSLADKVGRKPFDSIFSVLRKRCSLILQSGPVAQAQWRAMSAQGDQAAMLKAVRIAQGRIIDLLVAHNVEPNAAYCGRAVEELRNLVSWPTWVEPVHVNAPLDWATAEAGVAALIAIDWLWEDLTELDRLKVLQALRHRVVEAYSKAVAAGAWWTSVYHSYGAVIHSGCGLVAMALGDDEPKARQVHQLCRAGLKNFLDALGREGGWDEGLAYWGYAMRYILLLAEGSDRLLDDQTIFHSRGMDSTGLFPVYFSPHGQHAGFGDSPAVPLYGALYLLAKHYGQKELTWWLDSYAFHRDASSTDWSAAGLAMLFRPIDAETRSLDLSPVRVFHEIGWAAMADKWPSPSLYVSAKTGDLAAHHSHHDMNALQVQVDGEMLLADNGPAPFDAPPADAPQGELHEAAATRHNTLVVGQRDLAIDAQGDIVEAQMDKNYRWISCDAGTACGENVGFMRHAVMLVDKAGMGQALVVLDDIRDAAPERVDLLWHCGPSATAEAGAAGASAGVIAGAAAKLHYRLISSLKANAEIVTRKTPSQSHSVLHLTTPASSSVLIASIFSRKAVSAQASVAKAAGGEIHLKAGTIELVFKSKKRGLELAKCKL